MKEEGKKVIIIILIIILVCIVAYVGYYEYYMNHNRKIGLTMFEMDSDKIIITKYDSNKEEEKTVTLKGNKRKQVLNIMRNFEDVDNYNDENFDYDYKIDFANEQIAYLNSTERIIDIQRYGYVQITKEDCKLIEDFLK